MMNKSYKKITSFEEACKKEKLDPIALVKKWKKNGDTIDEIAYKKWKLFIKAINGKWVANFKDVKQRKWFGWLWLEPDATKPAGFRVVDTHTHWSGTGTLVGSRLCCETEEQYRHALKYGEDIYLEMQLS